MRPARASAPELTVAPPFLAYDSGVTLWGGDLIAATGDMITYNGGWPLTCDA